MKKKIITYIFCILITEAIGFAAGMLTRDSISIYAETLAKPPLAPPGLVFPIAWSILYALMGIGMARVWLKQELDYRMKGICAYIIQLALNFAWCFIFFSFGAYLVALIELVVLLIAVVVMTVLFKKSDKPAALIQIPYICWLCFATYLNAGVLVLN